MNGETREWEPLRACREVNSETRVSARKCRCRKKSGIPFAYQRPFRLAAGPGRGEGSLIHLRGSVRISSGGHSGFHLADWRRNVSRARPDCRLGVVQVDTLRIVALKFRVNLPGGPGNVTPDARQNARACTSRALEAPERVSRLPCARVARPDSQTANKRSRESATWPPDFVIWFVCTGFD